MYYINTYIFIYYIFIFCELKFLLTLDLPEAHCKVFSAAKWNDTLSSNNGSNTRTVNLHLTFRGLICGSKWW